MVRRSFDVKIAGVGYNFGQKGGIAIGEAPLEPGAPVVQTITIPSFHHGPGQVVGRDPAQYLSAVKLDTSRRNLVMPGGATTELTVPGGDTPFDGVHGAGWCQVNDRIFLITPKHIYEVTHGTPDVVSDPARYTVTGNARLTGSWARWRGKVIFGIETTPAAAIGGDSSARYAEAAPVLYDIATNAFSDLATPDAWEFVSYITEFHGTLWWVQNKGKFGPPDLRWTDKTDTDFGSIATGDTYGPFTIPQGGYATWLHMAGPHILVFKRDGSIIGVDQAKIWVPYTPKRGDIADDLFGHNATQFLSQICVQDTSGALFFSPSTLELRGAEPSRIQQYVATADSTFMQRIQAFATRNSELYVLGESSQGVAMYQGGLFEDEGFFYSSDYGVYALPDTVPADIPFTLQSASGGSELQGSGTDKELQSPAVADTFSQEAQAATIHRHVSSTVDHSHLYAANRVKTTDKVRLYRIDLPDIAWKNAPSAIGVGRLTTSRLFGDGPLAGVDKLALFIRGGFVVLPSGSILIVSLGVNEGTTVVVGAPNATGSLSIPIGAPQANAPGRSFTIALRSPADAGFRLETPLYLDVLPIPRANEKITVSVETGIPDNYRKPLIRESAQAGMLALEALYRSSVELEFAWGTKWTVWVENVEVRQSEAESPAGVGRYLVNLTCRRLV